jgi:phosphoribosylformylglycinamidine cyclo-ligase
LSGGPDAAAYRAAGVDLDEGQRAVSRIRALVRSTFTPRVESEIGAFAGFFSFPEPGSERLLVSSMDGVGTKLKLAAMTGRWEGAGWDIVAHCVDDILVHGASPLFFLDYIGAGRLSADVVEALVLGMRSACLEADCALIGGETAEMPGMYPPGELDLVGTIVGEVRRSDLIDGRSISPGDRILGLRSSGLHTNGYSLARRITGVEENPSVLEQRIPGSDAPLADLLLERHRLYLPLIRPLLRERLIPGMAHITGGGILENLPRILPPGVRAVIRRDAWQAPPLFLWLRERGRLDLDECYRVFNMGIGYVLVIAAADHGRIREILAAAGEDAVDLGWCEPGDPSVRWAAGDEREPS